MTAEHFQVDAQKSAGFRPDCKACRHAIYATKTPDGPKLRARALARLGLKACCACREAKPFDAFSARAASADGRSERCRDCKKEYNKARRAADPEKFDAPFKAYKSRNQDSVRERARLYMRRKRVEDPKFRLRGAIAKLAGCFLKRRGQTKAGKSFFNAVGYSIEELVRHIEKQFLPGMSWSNYGDWHLDHIVPNASFDYTSMQDSEFKACWSLSNLRPLWAIDNLKKSDSLTTLL